MNAGVFFAIWFPIATPLVFVLGMIARYGGVRGNLWPYLVGILAGLSALAGVALAAAGSGIGVAVVISCIGFITIVATTRVTLSVFTRRRRQYEHGQSEQ
jgi:hypothetical protein